MLLFSNGKEESVELKRERIQEVQEKKSDLCKVKSSYSNNSHPLDVYRTSILLAQKSVDHCYFWAKPKVKDFKKEIDANNGESLYFINGKEQ